MVIASLILSSALAAEPPASSIHPVPSTDIVAARVVELERPWKYTWSASPRTLSSAVVVVLRVDPQLGRQKSTWNPVLYASDAPAEILRVSEDARCMLALLPTSDLAATSLYFGSMRLPEDVTPALGAAELQRASAAGVLPVGDAALPLLTGGPVGLRDLRAEGPEMAALFSACQ